MANNLVIVESPAKAKTIEKFLGKDYTVLSSFGHIRDLAKKDLGIDISNNYSPYYEISEDKKKTVADLKKAVKSAKTVWLASDEDREGEAIAWHLFEVLKLSLENSKRIVFHEITKTAILNAIENPREINLSLVDAQQARRILDRIVGFELSPVLWKKVKPSLSAGRVQSVAVRIIVEREREIINFKAESSYKLVAHFFCTKNGKKFEFKSELSKKFPTKNEALNLLNTLKNASFTVSNVETKPFSKSPSAPFTTSTLQQEASRKLGFPVAKTMLVAQQLYESGFITYMRTDSVNLSDLALNTAKKVIIDTYGDKYSKTRKFNTKTKGAQEAHEAIRPTYMENEVVSDNYDQQRLYELIRKRTIASQMADALLEKTTVDISFSSDSTLTFQVKGEVVLFEGFLKVYMESTDEENEEKNIDKLPPILKGDKIECSEINAIERFTQHPPRYTEAGLVRKLEELGIGRPSTYAPTISTIQKRGYIVKEDKTGIERTYNFLKLKNGVIEDLNKIEIVGSEKGKMFPTDIGMVVNDFLVKYFHTILDYNFTAKVEKEFDDIAEGNVDWRKMIDVFYKTFHRNVEDTIETSERGTGERSLGVDPSTNRPVFVKIGRFGPMVQLGNNDDEIKPSYASIPKQYLLETITLEDALKLLDHSKEGRFLGKHPENDKPLFVKIGRFGPFVQLGSSDDKEKPLNASLLKTQNPETISLDDALELFKLPRTLGEYEGKKVTVGVGRFGPYISHSGSFASLKKGVDDPMEISLDRAIELLNEKKEKDEKRTIKLFPENSDFKIILDRWNNPSVYYKKKYFRIPKGKKPEELTLEDCYTITGANKKAAKSNSKTKKK